MVPAKKDIISRLQKDLLIRQGLKKKGGGIPVDMGLGRINVAFPNHTFPLSVIHEFSYTNAEDNTATCGFIAGLVSPIMQSGGIVFWLSPAPLYF